jgi:hypothetical protein
MLLLVGILLSSSFTALAQQGPLPEYEVKSAFLYNFAKFIQWPPGRFENASDPLVVGVYGKNPFNGFLKALEGKFIGTHKIVITHVESPAEARHCHILFIGVDKARGARLVEELRGYNVLTVTDEMEIEGFQSVGAVINLTTTANRTVHFEINVDAARRAELKINSSLLNLAKIVRDGRA